MNRRTCHRLLQVDLPVLFAATALATETDPCPKLEVIPASSGGHAVALASTGTGGTDVQTAEAIPEEGGNWKAEKPVAVNGKALTKFTVTPSDYEVIATLWHKLDSPSTQATAQTNGAGELKLRLVAQDGAPSSATVIVDIYRTILPSSGVQGSLTLDGNAYSLAQAFVEHEQQSYTLNVGEELPLITLSGSASLSGMGALVVQTSATAAVQPCGATPAEETDDADDDESDPEDHKDCGSGDGGGEGGDGGSDDGKGDGQADDGNKDCPECDANSSSCDDGDEDGDDGDGDGDGECEGNGDAGDALHIHLTTGHIWTAIPIFRAYAAGSSELDVKLRYDSIRAQEDGPLGWGWTHSYNIYVQQVGNKVIYQEGNGRRNVFTWNGSSYTKPIGRAFQLIYTGGHFELHRTNGTKEIFNPLDGGIGRISQIVDRRGRTLRFTYNGSQLTQIVSPHGRSVTIEWFGTRVWRITDPDSKVTTFEYWPGGELKKITDPLLHSVQYEYDGQRRVTKETLKNGKFYTAQYADGPDTHTLLDSQGQIIAQVVPDAGLTLPDVRTATISGGWLTHRDGRGLLWRVRRDNLGRLRQIISPNGYSWKKEYGGPTAGNNRNRVTRITNERTHYRTFTWNADGNLIQRRDEAGHVTQFEYHSTFKTKLTRRTEPDGDAWVYQYDPNTGDLLTIVDPLNESQHGYPADRVVSFVYETHPAGVENLPGRIKKKTKVDRNGHITVLEYDTAGNLIQVARGADDPTVRLVTTFEHDAMGRTTRRVIERGDRQIITDWTYDPLGRLLDTIQDPGSSPALNLTTSRAYDPHGKLETRTDPRGIITRYEYDHRNRLKKRIEAFGTLNLTTEWFRDGNGNVERRVAPEQHQTVYVYNEQNFRTQSTDAEGYVTSYTPDPAGNVLRVDRGLNPGLGGPQYSVRYVYDPLHRITQRIVDPDNLSLTTQYEYALSGGGCGCSGTPGRALPYKITDPKGKVTYFHYDKLDRRTKIVRKVNGDDGEQPDLIDDALTQFEYDPHGNLTATVRPEGERIEFEYDAVHRRELARAIHVGGDIVTGFNYDGANNVIAVTQPNGTVVELAYDGANRLETATDDLGALASFVYDENGNVRFRSSAIAGQTWEYRYDAADRLWKVFDPIIESPTDRYTEFAYDDNGNRIEVIDNNGVRTRYVYDGLDRLVQMVENYQGTDDTANTSTSYGYNGVRQTSISDHDGNTTNYVYDTALRLWKIEYPDNSPPGAGVVEFDHDAVGNVTWRKDQRGVETTYTYNDLHQLTGRAYGGTAPPRSETFQFDRSGRLKVADNDVAELDFAYDDLGRLDTATQTYVSGPPYTTRFNYVVAPGDVRRIITYPSGRVVTETYDGRLRLQTIDGGPGIGADYSYDLADRRTAATLGNGVSSVFGFDLADRLTSIQHARDVTALFDVEYGYDSRGNPLFTRNLTPGFGDRSELYEYDDRHRLRRFDRGEISGGATPVLETAILDDALPARQEWLDLDGRGNWRAIETLIGVPPASITETRTHSVSNEISAIDPDGPGPLPLVGLTWDLAGNLLADPGAGGTNGHQYEYDEEGRLTEVKQAPSGDPLLRVLYDAVGRRVETYDYVDAGSACAQSTPIAIRHIYLHVAVAEEYLSCDGSQWQLAREFIWTDQFPQAVALVTHGGANGGIGGASVPPGIAAFHYLTDRMTSVVALTNANGDIVERYAYDPYGNPTIENPLGNRLAASGYGNPLAWTGQTWSPAARIYLFRYRAYSPRLGRWIQRDPLGYMGRTSLYEYVASSPLAWIDPLGLAPNKKQCLDPKDLKEKIKQWEKEGKTREEILRLIRDYFSKPDGPRYVWTDKYGWIDLRHFGESADWAEDVGSVVTEVLGYLNEVAQWATEGQDDYQSGFSPEDLPSNSAGADFGDDYLNDNESVSESVDRFLNDSGARPPSDPATGFDNLPDTDPAVGGGGSGGSNPQGSNSSSNPPNKQSGSGGSSSPPPYYPGICFVRGTVVQTPGGFRPIQTIRVGDTVLSWDFESSALTSGTVSEVRHGKARNLILIDAGTERLVCTPEHQFYVDGEWVKACDIASGCTLDSLWGRVPVVCATEQERATPADVYTITVEGTHNFFVGSLEILAHNKPP